MTRRKKKEEEGEGRLSSTRTRTTTYEDENDEDEHEHEHEHEHDPRTRLDRIIHRIQSQSQETHHHHHHPSSSTSPPTPIPIPIPIKSAQIESDYYRFLTQSSLKLKTVIHNPTRLSNSSLHQLWILTINLRRPSDHWIESLLLTTIHHAHLIQPRSLQIQLTRYLSFALGILIQSIRSFHPITPSHRARHRERLTRWLWAIQEWQEVIEPTKSIELDQRHLQIIDSLGHHYDLRALIPNSRSDPYLISNILRKLDDSEDLIDRLHGSQDQLLQSIKVACRSSGRLIHQTHPSGPHQILSSNQAQTILSDRPQPSFWRTGLILSHAQRLVGQIQLIIQEDRHHLLSNINHEFIKTLNQLIELSLSHRDLTLYGGQVERFRLLRRQADGLELIIDHLLSHHHLDFGLVFDLITICIGRVGHQVIRTRAWKTIVSSHLKRSADWSGPAGLERLFELIIDWSHRETRSDSLPEPIKFKKLMPGDLGLLMIERVLFPEDDHDYRNGKQADHSLSSDSSRMTQNATDDPFDRLIERIDKMSKFVASLGNPRRFRDKRLMRLIFLSVQKRRKSIELLAHPDSQSELPIDYDPSNPHQCPDTLISFYDGGHAYQWWNRPEIWRELDFKLARNLTSDRFQSPDPTPDHHASQADHHTPSYDPSLEFHDQYDFCPSHLSFAHLAGEYNTRLDDQDPGPFTIHPTCRSSNRSSDHVELADHPSGVEESNQTELDDRSDPKGATARTHQTDQSQHLEDKNARPKGDQVHSIPNQLDLIDDKLKLESRNYFDQHSILTCLIVLIKKQFF